ncbi:hypothetical protein FF38_09645 [Lucilia cuprina]|uniref:BPTI/Kunitz inhibitor domain-containing protein n=1 Tax=Lucilia cuprina TaxID=7375 RepID=A0A0L0BX66_LUCCU|nr:hypothetical protein FF38_09645 [Lucilia cuprina]
MKINNMNLHIFVFSLVFLLTLALEDFISEICYEEPLLSPKECFGNFTTWSYMNKTNTCEKFIYTGCMDSCFEEPFVTSSECSGSFKAWSYIAKTNSCKEFTYTGCLGNDNRYTSEQECKGMCVVSPNTEDDEEHEGIMFYM